MNLEKLLNKIVKSNYLHAKWLNTLSYLENCGARKIAACEDPTKVREEILKHASEEFRHAHYLKKQISKVSQVSLQDYSLSNLIGGVSSLQYLNVLDLFTSKYLFKLYGYSKYEVRSLAYLLVTYAIELRAEKLYPIYEKVLRSVESNVYVKSIILEEEEHLNEMKQGLSKIESGIIHAEIICKYEELLYQKWILAIDEELKKIK